MGEDLRARLIGAWRLVSYEEIPVDGSDPFEPLGHEPLGIIMYTPDGYMSAQLSRPDRPAFASGDWFNGTTEDGSAARIGDMFDLPYLSGSSCGCYLTAVRVSLSSVISVNNSPGGWAAIADRHV